MSKSTRFSKRVVERMCLIAFAALALTGPASAKTLLLLPIVGDLEKASDLATVNGLYKDALTGSYKGEVKTIGKDSAHNCAEKDCALKLAAASGADEVIMTNLHPLGTKLVFSSTLIETKGGDAFNQHLTAQSTEDLEAVSQRVADALVNRKSLEQVASLDNITAKEENSEPTRRRSLFTTGVSLGYLFPIGGTFSYLKSNSTSGFGECPCTEKQPYSQMVRLAWLNSWEFRDDMRLSFDGTWAIPNVIGGDINLQYLFSRSDFSPFVGGGLGLQVVVPMDDTTYSSKRNTGPAVDVQAGMIMFRTYDINLVAKAQYQVIFDSDVDNGVSFDLGVVYRPREKAASHDGLGFWSYLGIALLGSILIGAIAH